MAPSTLTNKLEDCGLRATAVPGLDSLDQGLNLLTAALADARTPLDELTRAAFDSSVHPDNIRAMNVAALAADATITELLAALGALNAACTAWFPGGAVDALVVAGADGPPCKTDPEGEASSGENSDASGETASSGKSAKANGKPKAPTKRELRMAEEQAVARKAAAVWNSPEARMYRKLEARRWSLDADIKTFHNELRGTQKAINRLIADIPRLQGMANA